MFLNVICTMACLEELYFCLVIGSKKIHSSGTNSAFKQYRLFQSVKRLMIKPHTPVIQPIMAIASARVILSMLTHSFLIDVRKVYHRGAGIARGSEERDAYDNLTITTAICAFGWLVSRISAIAMIRYVKIKGYERPTNAELNECIRWAAKRVFKRVGDGGDESED